MQRWRLCDSLHRVGSEGIAQRSRGRLHRRTYHVIRWNFVIIGGVDGFSCLPVMLQCSDNNKADTVLACFVSAVNEYGLPSRIRTDKRLENVGIAQFMIQNRGTNREIPLHYHVFNLNIGDTKHSLIRFVCVLSGIFYLNLGAFRLRSVPIHLIN